MLPKNWGHLWGQSPLKRAYSAPYKCNPNSAREIANALNVEADFDGNNAINADVDETRLLQAFANEGGMTMSYLTVSSVVRGAGPCCTSAERLSTGARCGEREDPLPLWFSWKLRYGKNTFDFWN